MPFQVIPNKLNELAQRLIEEEIKNSTLSVRYNQLEALTKNYEAEYKKATQDIDRTFAVSKE